MNILITGGAGFIGSHTTQQLQEAHSIVIVDCLNDYYNPEYKKQNLTLLSPEAFYEADITDVAAMEEIFSKHQFDLVIHLAARAGVRPSIENPALYSHVNITGTYTILEMMRKFSVPRIIFGGSSSVYGDTAVIPFSEDQDCLEPISPYAATKRAGEILIEAYHQRHNIKATCLRFFTVYGERGRPDMAPYLFTNAIINDKPINKFGDGTTSRDYTYVKDIAAGIERAVETPLDFEIINLGHHDPVTLNEFIATVEELAGKQAEINQMPMQPGDVSRTYADISKAKQLLQWEPTVSFQDGMKRFVDWFVENRANS